MQNHTHPHRRAKSEFERKCERVRERKIVKLKLATPIHTHIEGRCKL